jgi:hypothetical protein
LPPLVLRRAEEILKSMELRRDLLRQGVALDETSGDQFLLFRPAASPSATEDRMKKVRELVAGFDIDASTPLEALQLVKKIQDELENA